MNNELENSGKILIYQNEKGDTKIDVYFEDETISPYEVALSPLVNWIISTFQPCPKALKANPKDAVVLPFPSPV